MAGCLLAAPLLAAEAPPLVVGFDKAELLSLSAPARRVILGNPAIADVTVEQPTLLAVFGKIPGETSLIVLGEGNKVLLNRAMVVSAPSERRVTVHTSAEASRDYSCLSERCLVAPVPSAQGAGGSPAGAVAAAVK
jgi:Flp pilus assembly secretin CpaC